MDNPEGTKYFSSGKPFKSRFTRRAACKDYTDSGYYFITILTKDSIPHLSKITSADGNILYELTPLGNIIKEKIETIPQYTSQLSASQYIIMPDHIHILLYAKESLPRHLGRIIGGFMGGCTTEARNASIIPKEESLFTQKFHDRLIRNMRQVATLRKYITDNPRRLLIKRLHPTLFKRYLHIRIGAREYAAFGNIFLLKHFNLLTVKIHRRWSTSEFDNYEQQCKSEIDSGAIPISPFIHPREKKIRDYAMANNGKLIMLKESGFEERFKPQGREFELCAEGRLLLLAPWPDNTGRKSKAGYTEFHTMNDMAFEISSLNGAQRTSIISPL